ncbi:MAG: NAD(+) synthase, partial [Eggerthellaceae bacterium]|nr:NAD(+) synthase [Eggerthellaceae bacterium]
MTANRNEGVAQAAPFFNPEAAFEACVSGLREFMDATFGLRDHHVLLGLSGGIDSALVAVMAVAAFGPERVHAVTMPGPYTSEATRADAETLAENLGIWLDEIDIEEAFNAMMDAVEDGANVDLEDTIAAQNIQARLRMVSLMALSNLKGWTVLNTGNLSEACMG